MYYKISPLALVLLLLVIGAITALGVYTIRNNEKDYKANVVANERNGIVPTLDLNASPTEENQDSVTINVVASTVDEGGIHSIILPDGKSVLESETSYTVYENGNYTFKTRGNNGQVASLVIEITNIKEASANTPYMPTGFHYVGGEANHGYVIADRYGNEFVWVPVETGKLVRDTMLEAQYEDNNNTTTALVNSVAKNYGFYIARYESSPYQNNRQYVAASIAGRTPWVNITYTDAVNAAQGAAETFGYEGYSTSLINSYAWDTVLAWIDSTYNDDFSTSMTNTGNYSGTIRNAGSTESDIRNNICDLAGNVREWTTEIYKNSTPSTNRNDVLTQTVTYRMIRGGGASAARSAKSHTAYKDNSTDPFWGFRMILYK